MDLYKPESQANKQDPVIFILLTSKCLNLKVFTQTFYTAPHAGTQ